VHQAIHPEIHILELSATETEMGLLVSLAPCESICGDASKLKGAASKTIRELQGHSAFTRKAAEEVCECWE